MTRQQIMEDMDYSNLDTVSATLCRARKTHPEITIRVDNNRRILINPYLMPRTTKEERKRMETLYWKLEEKIGQAAINRGVADFLEQSYLSVYFYFRNFNFIQRETYNKYFRALQEVEKRSNEEETV